MRSVRVFIQRSVDKPPPLSYFHLQILWEREIMAARKHYIIGVDTGGTFTDVVVLGDSGQVWTAKASTTPDDFSRGVMDAVKEASNTVGVETAELLGQTDRKSVVEGR